MTSVSARRVRAFAVALTALALAAACASAPDLRRAEAARPATSGGAVFVVRRGWHSGIAIDRAALAARGLPPEAADFPDAAFLEFGWGDRAYYMSPDPSTWSALRAAMTPTRAALHVAPLARPPSATSASDVVQLDIEGPALASLAEAISASFHRAGAAPAQALAGRAAPHGRFYAATGSFHILNTCNSWVARMLAQAGVDIDPSGVVTAGALMRRVRKAGADLGSRLRALSLRAGEDRGARRGSRAHPSV